MRAKGDDLREHFDEFGFIFFPGYFTADEVAVLSEAVDAAPGDDPSFNALSLGAMAFSSNLYRNSTAVQDLVGSRKIVALLADVGMPHAWMRWDQAVTKEPGAPVFPWHQDNGYTGLDAVHIQLWVALTSADATNGALTVAPGGHQTRLDHRWVGNHVVTDTPATELTLTAEPGDAILFSSLLPHMTGENVSDRTRIAYIAEFLSIDDVDQSVESPHFIVSQSGRPHPEWRDLTAE